MRRLPLVLVPLLALASCRPDGWEIHMPKDVSVTPPTSVHFSVLSVMGGVKPGPVQKLDARCADPAVCEARATPGDVEVIPKQPGSTTVIVNATNMYNKVERHTVAVTVQR